MNTILGEKVEIQGDVIVQSGILIHGKVKGNVKSTGTVRTAEGSLITGKIASKNALISGTVDGDLVVDQKVVLGEKSKVKGNLRTKILVIEEGAQFDGLSSMGSTPEPAPEVKKPSPVRKANLGV